MAVHRLVHPSDSTSSLLVDGATITIIGSVSLEAPKAATLLSALPPELRLDAVEDFLEHGAATAIAVQSSAHVVLLETKINELTTQLTEALDVQLRTAGDQSAEETEKLLAAHKEALTKLLLPLTDPNTKNGLPAVLVELLDHANKEAMNHIAVMLKDGEEGALGKAVKQITDQLKEVAATITKVIVEREALRTRSNRRGGCFEDVLSVRLPILTRGMGRVEHCAHTEGEKAGDVGDYLITVETAPGGEAARIAVEAKSHKNRISANAIKAELKRARDNRGAAAGVFVVENAEILPDGIGFGQVSECDFFVAYDPEDGDETALTCALYMAKVVALAAIINDSSSGFDLTGIQREVSVIRGLLEQFSRIETCHSKIDKEVTAARTLAADLKSDILDALRRLDSFLSR
jgi:hypothetical protein